MTPAVEETGRVSGAAAEARPTVRRKRRRTRSQPVTREARGRLRMMYFGGAALWGFITGTGSILIGLSLVETRFHPGPVGLTLIAVAAVLALVGGLISSAAYRQASSRGRR